MTEDLNCDLFWRPKWLGNCASEADIQHTFKSSSNWHVINQDQCKTSGFFFLEKGQRPEFWLILGSKVAQKWASEAHILHTSKSTYNEHVSLRWHHNERDSVSNHQPHDCLLNRLFRHRSKKTLKLRVTGLCVGNSPGTGEFPTQMASYAENISIWWRHHGSNTKVEPEKTSWENDQRLEFWLVLGSKTALKLGLWGPYSTHL